MSCHNNCFFCPHDISDNGIMLLFTPPSCCRLLLALDGTLSGKMFRIIHSWLLPACFYCLVSAIVTAFTADGAETVVVFANGRSIDTAATSAFSVHAADLDGDGDLDVIAALIKSGRVVWYENLDGNGTFSDAVEISPCCDRDGPRYV